MQLNMKDGHCSRIDIQCITICWQWCTLHVNGMYSVVRLQMRMLVSTLVITLLQSYDNSYHSTSSCYKPEMIVSCILFRVACRLLL